MDPKRKGKRTARRGNPASSLKKAFKRLLQAARFAALYLALPVLVGAATGGFLAFSKGVPSIAELKQDITPPSTRIYSDDDTLIGELKIMKGQYVTLDRMPRSLINAVVSVEDSHFWEHSGVDYLAIARAAAKDIMKRHLKEGGSTITQQLAKITFLTPEKTFSRKLKEFVLAHRIERNLTKDEIIELYLNRAYFGHGAYGAVMAARVYFDKPLRDLTLPESALIAGLLKAPASYSPYRDFGKARDRQGIVLKRMEEEGYISREEREEAMGAQVLLSKASSEGESYNYFLDYVKRHLEKTYGSETIYKGGLSVYTTMDRVAQETAQRKLQEGLRDLDKRRGWRGPVGHREPGSEAGGKGSASFVTPPPAVGDILEGVVASVNKIKAEVEVPGAKGTLYVKDAGWARKALIEGKEKWINSFDLTKILKPGDVIMVGVKSEEGGDLVLALEQEPEVQGALVAVESHSGFIRALVGGYDFEKSEFNRALYARRQVGSAFKPIIYSVALENGFTPATVLVDEEVTFENGPDDIWTPKNYDEEFHGPTRLRDALAFSRNVVTVKLLDEIGIDRVIKFANEIGMDCEMPRDLTISLGSMCVTPLELTSVYGAFANNGVRMEPIAIKYITDRRGRVIESRTPRAVRVLDQQTSFLMTSMLRSVVDYGTGWRARELGRPVAGKTGTTNDYRDAWFLGYTTDMVAGVWVGFDDMEPLGEEETGSRAAAPIWVAFMKDVADANASSEGFTRPEGIVTRLIDPATGLLANRWTENPILEYFRDGTEPTVYSPTIWQTNEPAIFFY